MVKNSPAKAQVSGLIPGSERYPGGEQGSPVFLPGSSRGRRSQTGYSRWGHKESDMNEQLNNKRHMIHVTETRTPNRAEIALE